jgi:hypothetical protein
MASSIHIFWSKNTNLKTVNDNVIISITPELIRVEQSDETAVLRAISGLWSLGCKPLRVHKQLQLAGL